MMFGFGTRRDTSDDSGVAIVAATGVAMVGAVLALLVVSQVIIVTNDVGRDRVRTTEVHSAEGVLDSVVYSMAQSLPCEWPDNPVLVGSGATETSVDVDIEYFDVDGVALTSCSGGIVEGDAGYAVISAQSSPVVDAPGIEPVRTMEATVRVTPRQGLSTGTTLFTSSDMNVTNNGAISSTNPDEPAGLWIDTGNLVCDSNFTVNGDVVVVEGGARVTNSCAINGDAWVRDYLDDSSGNKSKTRVAGDVTVREGSMAVHNASKYGGSLTVSGNISGNGFDKSIVDGTICASHIDKLPSGKTYAPCTSYVDFEQRGFPEITWNPSDWTAEGFTIKPLTGVSSWTEDVLAGWDGKSGQAWYESWYRDAPCRMDGTHIKDPIELSATPSVYDLRSCNFTTSSKMTFVLNSDTAIFANSIDLSNQNVFLSGDGEAHKLWLIVPQGAPGNLTTSNQTRIEAPLAAFYYSPNYMSISNNQAIRGQIYGKNLHVANHFAMEHVSVGVPGVDLGTSDLEVTSSGFQVELLSKRERQRD